MIRSGSTEHVGSGKQAQGVPLIWQGRIEEKFEPFGPGLRPIQRTVLSLGNNQGETK